MTSPWPGTGKKTLTVGLGKPSTGETFREYLDNVDAEALTTRFHHPNFSTEMGGETLDLVALLEFEKSLKSLADLHFEPVRRARTGCHPTPAQ